LIYLAFFVVQDIKTFELDTISDLGVEASHLSDV
jgi:hypothetical protein